jgi:hypothetical protein
MNSLFQLEIPKRNTHCFQQKERLLPGMEIYSLLVEDQEKRGFLRHDFCALCWSQVQNEAEKLTPRIYWKSKIEYRKPFVESSRTMRALALLRKLQQVREPLEEEIFVLCLFLSHARQLALRQEFQKDGETYQLYEVLQQEEYLTVKALNISSFQIETIQKSLASKLTLLC